MVTKKNKGHKQKEKDETVQEDAEFAVGLTDSKFTSDGMLCKFGGHQFVQTSWACKKQTAASHSSTEAKVMSLDTGLRIR